MAIDLLNLQPSVISRDLKGKFVCIYSIPKAGKTSLACQFPKNLLFGFEHGWNAISGAMAVDITKWSEFKLYLRQLEKAELKEKYNTITIDTVGLAWEMCEQYICTQNGVQKISDIPWGGGYTACKKEFESCLRKITQLGYGLVIIAHCEKRIEKRSDDSEVEILGPAIPKRAYDIVNQLVDIIGYIDVTWDENGNSERWLYTRKGLVDGIAEAIEKSEKLDGAVVVDTEVNAAIENEPLHYDEIRAEAQELWGKLIAQNEENAARILKKVEMIFGRPMKLSEITEDQVDLYNLVVIEMREMLK